MARAARSRSAAGSRGFAAAVALLVCAIALPASAAEGSADGRIEGDVGLWLGAGTAIAEGGPSFAARVSAMYVGTAGLYAIYTDAFGSDGPAVRRSIAAGLSLRPLFLGRYASELARGPTMLDRLVDSLDFDLGAFWHANAASSFDNRPGLEIALGFDVPLLDRTTGPYVGVRAAMRWRAEDLAPGASGGFLDRGALLSFTLAWHDVIGAHVVDAGDEVVR